MNEPTALSEPMSVSERTVSQSKLREFGIRLSRRQTVLRIGLAIVVSVILWRRRVNRSGPHSSEQWIDSETVDNGQSTSNGEDPIYVPQDPDDELEGFRRDRRASDGEMGGG